MPQFNQRSRKNLNQAHPGLQKLFNEVIKHFDCSIICSYRNELAQNMAYEAKRSNAVFGESPHNFEPSLAVDVIPYPVDWKDHDRMQYFAGQVMGIAQMMGIEIKWGGDWDRDTHLSDNRFNDLPHFELANWRKIAELEP
jgi:peptidoglycan L-alanyl-D-glutamate endopeptidase CwlK